MHQLMCRSPVRHHGSYMLSYRIQRTRGRLRLNTSQQPFLNNRPHPGIQRDQHWLRLLHVRLLVWSAPSLHKFFQSQSYQCKPTVQQPTWLQPDRPQPNFQPEWFQPERLHPERCRSHLALSRTLRCLQLPRPGRPVQRLDKQSRGNHAYRIGLAPPGEGLAGTVLIHDPLRGTRGPEDDWQDLSLIHI